MIATFSLLALLTVQPAQDTVGLLVVAHGADSAWNARVHQTVAQVAWPGPVRTAFLMGAEAKQRSWNSEVEALVAAGARRIIVVPLMVSTHGSHVRQIEHYAGVRAELPAELARSHQGHAPMSRPTVPVAVTRAIDDADELGLIMADRWAALAASDRMRPLVLIAHGPSGEADVGPWLDGIRSATRPVERRLGAGRLHIGLLRDDAGAEVRGAAIRALRDTISHLAEGDSVTVMTVLISSGSIDRVKIPADLAGMPVRYVGVALAPHPALARWIERMGRAAAAGPFNDTRTSAHTHH